MKCVFLHVPSLTNVKTGHIQLTGFWKIKSSLFDSDLTAPDSFIPSDIFKLSRSDPRSIKSTDRFTSGRCLNNTRFFFIDISYWSWRPALLVLRLFLILRAKTHLTTLRNWPGASWAPPWENINEAGSLRKIRKFLHLNQPSIEHLVLDLVDGRACRLEMTKK